MTHQKQYLHFFGHFLLRNKYFTKENHFASFGNNHDHRDSSSSGLNFSIFEGKEILKKYKCTIKKCS